MWSADDRREGGAVRLARPRPSSPCPSSRPRAPDRAAKGPRGIGPQPHSPRGAFCEDAQAVLGGSYSQ